MSRILLTEEIVHYLATFSVKTGLLNANHQFDINGHAENLYLRILNIIFDLNLENANFYSINYPAIDLIDREKGIAFQITSQSDVKKISDTLLKVKKSYQRNGIREIYVLIFSEKENPSYYRKKREVFQEITGANFRFEPDTHILDYRDIYRRINATNRIDKIESILNILQEELELRSDNLIINSSKKILLVFDKSLLEEAHILSKSLIERRYFIYYTSDELFNKFANDSYLENLIPFTSFDPTIEAGIYLMKEDFERQEKMYVDSQPLGLILKEKKKYYPIYFAHSFPENYIDNRNFRIAKVSSIEEYETQIEAIIKSLKEVDNSPELKGYGSVLTILKAQSPNGIFECLKEVKEKKQNIGYTLYRKTDPIEIKMAYYLFLYEGTSQKTTVDLIKQNHPEIFKEHPLIVLMPKEPDQKDIEQRISNFKSLLKPKNIYYLDNYIWKYCTDSNFKSENSATKYLEIKNFVRPTVKEYSTNSKKSINAITDWLASENKPVLVLKGGGGLGKTTVAQSISDHFVKTKTDSTVIFIDSQQIVHELNKRFNESESLDLYTFYDLDSQLKQKGKARLSLDLFKINLDLGNILIILDGLDEVFSKVQNFDINLFLQSIFSYISDAGDGKVLITCRDYFWKNINVDFNDQIESFELLPFDRKLAEEFFRSKYPNDLTRLKRCMKYADSFIADSGKDEYIPYVLDVIGYVEESNSELLQDDISFESSILKQSNKTDYIIYRICYRETLKVKQINVDDQIHFFIRFAVFKNGGCLVTEFDSVFKQMNDKSIDKTSIETLKSHPLFVCQNNRIEFRYDFLNDYFKSIYLSQYIDIESKELPSPITMQILGSQCKYGAGILKDVTERIGNLNEDYLYKILDLINEINKFPESPQEINLAIKRKAISGLFSIALMLQHKYGASNIEANTNIMRQLFGYGQNQIINLSIVDFTGHSDKLRFDFSDLKIINAHINNFDSFWSSKFNDESEFDNCDLFNLNSPPNIQITAPSSIFKNCNTDETFTQVLKDTKSRLASKENQIRELLVKFFTLFNTKGKLERQGIVDIIKPRYGNFKNQPIKLEALLKILEAEYVIEFFTEFNEEKVAITDGFKVDVIKFVKEGTPSPLITSLLKELIRRTS